MELEPKEHSGGAFVVATVTEEIMLFLQRTCSKGHETKAPWEQEKQKDQGCRPPAARQGRPTDNPKERMSQVLPLSTV